jgi:hypothetical protein
LLELGPAAEDSRRRGERRREVKKRERRKRTRTIAAPTRIPITTQRRRPKMEVFVESQLLRNPSDQIDILEFFVGCEGEFMKNEKRDCKGASPPKEKERGGRGLLGVRAFQFWDCYMSLI